MHFKRRRTNEAARRKRSFIDINFHGSRSATLTGTNPLTPIDRTTGIASYAKRVFAAVREAILTGGAAPHGPGCDAHVKKRRVAELAFSELDP